MTSEHGALSYEELQAALQKSETHRSKLKATVGLLKERGVNTAALVQQHLALKTAHSQLETEATAERAAKEAAEQELRQARNERQQLVKDMAVLRQQSTGSQAATKKAGAQAAAAQKSADAAATAMRAELEALKRSVQQLEQRQQAGGAAGAQGGVPKGRAAREAAFESTAEAGVGPIKSHLQALQAEAGVGPIKSHLQALQAEAGVGPIKSHLQALQAQMGRLQSENEALRKAIEAPPSRHSEFQGLQQQVMMVRQDQQLMVSEMQRWKSFLGSFAALAGAGGAQAAAAAGPAPPSELGSGWQPISPTELMMEASNAPREAAGQPAAEAQHEGESQGLRSSAPGARSSESDRSGEGTAGDGARGLPHDAAASKSAAKRVIALVAPALGARSPAKRLRAADVEAAAAMPSGKRQHVQEPPSPSAATSDSSLPEDEATAADVVQLALSRITRQGEPVNEQVVQETAAALADAVADGLVPLPVIAAALHTALLDCAAPAHTIELTSEQYAAALEQLPQPQPHPEGVSIQELCFLRAWCLEAGGTGARFAHLLLCCHQLELQLGAEGGSRGPMAALHRRLHEAAVQLAGSADDTAPLLLPELCTASAAAGLLMRMCGDIQAFRKLLCDLLLECKARPSHALPAFAAAADAWPGGLPPAGPSDAARLWSAAADTAGRDHSSCGVALMHSLASRVCACHSASVRATNADDGDETTLAADLAVLCLRHFGRTFWDWRWLDASQNVSGKPADTISEVEAWSLLAALRREAAL